MDDDLVKGLCVSLHVKMVVSYSCRENDVEVLVIHNTRFCKNPPSCMKFNGRTLMTCKEKEFNEETRNG